MEDLLARLPFMNNHHVPPLTPKTWAAARRLQPALASKAS